MVPLRVQRILKLFQYSHLPNNLQEISRPFGELAEKVAQNYPETDETYFALRKLLEAKDCAVRASLTAD